MAASNGTLWKVATGAVSLVLVCAGATWGMIQVHQANPHPDAVPRSEMGMLRELIETKLEAQGQDLAEIKADVRELRRLVKE